MRKAQETIEVTKQPYIEDVGPRKMSVVVFSPFCFVVFECLVNVPSYRGHDRRLSRTCIRVIG